METSHSALYFIRENSHQVDIEILDKNRQMLKILDSSSLTPAILILNQHALDISLNWLCNVVSFPTVFQRLIIIALDDIAYNKIHSIWPSIHIFNWTVPAMSDYFLVGDGRYQLFQLFRSNLAAYICSHRRDFWMIQADTYWRENLFEIFNITAFTADLLFDREGDSGLASEMIAGGNFFVRSSQKSYEFFIELSRQLRYLYATDNNIMGSLCALEYHSSKCHFIPYNVIANWRWHSSDISFVPSLIQIDDIREGETKFSRMQRLGAKFVDDNGICLEMSQTPQFAVPHEKLSSTHSITSSILLQITQEICEMVAIIFPSIQWYLRVYVFPQWAYYVVI